VAFFKRVIEDDDLRSEIGFFDPEFYKIILKEKPRKKSKEKKVDIDRLSSMIK
jgi:hypothetical protein